MPRYDIPDLDELDFLLDLAAHDAPHTPRADAPQASTEFDEPYWEEPYWEEPYWDDEFWADVPTSPIERLTQRVPAVAAPLERTASKVAEHIDTVRARAASAADMVRTVAASMRTSDHHRYVDPVARRLGWLALVIALLVPVALALRDDATGAIAAAPDITTLAVGTAPTTVTTPPILLNPYGRGIVRGANRSTPANGTVAATADANRTIAIAEVCDKEYLVVNGDSWTGIADKVGVTTRDLLIANNTSSGSLLLPGETICLPHDATTPTTVAPGRVSVNTTAPYVPPNMNYSRAEIEQMIRDIWPDSLEEQAIAIAVRESNLNPWAKNYCCYGLFQIYWEVHKSWLPSIGVTHAEMLFDARLNIQAALVVYQRAGSWRPWGFN